MVATRLALVCFALLFASSFGKSIDSVSSDDARAPNVSTIVFQLFTPWNPTKPQILALDDAVALQNSFFNPSQPTKFFAHGWNGSPENSYSTRDEYLSREYLNFIAVDWSVLANGVEYPLIVERDVPRAAEYTGAFIDFLVENTGIPFSSIHLIGHSLGAHVVGGAGAAVTLGKVARITGLDPAGPFFALNDTSRRIDTTDGDFVDIIHTDGGTLTGNELGMLDPIGHVDFYPNGGEVQPGCNTLGPDDARNGCDHGRSVSYFRESINSPVGFRAVECESMVDFEAGLCNSNSVLLMGDLTPSTARGIFYLATNSKSPYALG